MGAADAVPGVAGGNVALLSGIYDELVRSLNEIDRHAARMLFRGEGRAVWEKITRKTKNQREIGGLRIRSADKPGLQVFMNHKQRFNRVLRIIDKRLLGIGVDFGSHSACEEDS